MNPKNPYTYTTIVGGSAFYDREDIFKTIERFAGSPSSRILVLQGERRVGKSSILQEVPVRLLGPACVYFSLDSHYAKDAADLVRQLLSDVDRALGGSPWKGGPAGSIDGHAARRELEPVLPPGSCLLLLLDEIDALDSHKLKRSPRHEFCSFLKGFLGLESAESRVKLICASAAITRQLSDELKELFKVKEQLRVRAFGPRDATALIRRAEALSPPTLRFSDDAIGRILQLGGGRPYITQAICSVLWDHLNPPGKQPAGLCPIVERAKVDELIPAFISQAEGGVQYQFAEFSQAEQIVLILMAEGTESGVVNPIARADQWVLRGAWPAQVEELREPPRVNSDAYDYIRGELEAGLRNLCERGLLEKKGAGYLLTTDLFRHYIVRENEFARLQEYLDDLAAAAGGALRPLWRAAGLSLCLIGCSWSEPYLRPLPPQQCLVSLCAIWALLGWFSFLSLERAPLAGLRHTRLLPVALAGLLACATCLFVYRPHPLSTIGLGGAVFLQLWLLVRLGRYLLRRAVQGRFMEGGHGA